MNVDPVVNVLRQSISEKLQDNESMQLSYERLVNTVQTHTHSLTHCLREVSLDKDEKEKMTTAANEYEGPPGYVMKGEKLYVCRFKFEAAVHTSKRYIAATVN